MSNTHTGTVTLWTPNSSKPHVRLLAHMGPVASISMDPSSAGRYMATSGMDGTVKVWDCRNWKGCVRKWNTRASTAEVEWSQRGMLSVACGGSVNVRSSLLPPTFLLKLMTTGAGIPPTGHNTTTPTHRPSTVIHDPPDPSPPALLYPVLPLPGYPHRWSFRRSLEPPCTGRGRTEFRQRRGGSIRGQERTAGKGGTRAA